MGRIPGVLLLAVVACAEATPAPATDRFTDGLYLLESLAGQQPPFVLDNVSGFRSTLLSDTLVLGGGISYEVPVRFLERAGQADTTVAGTRASGRAYRVSNDSLFFAVEGGAADTLRYSSRRLTGFSRSTAALCGGRCPIVYRRLTP